MKTLTRKKLDYLPYIILVLSSAYLLYSRAAGEVLLQYRHIAGLLLLPLPLFAFMYSHKLGVLTSGLLLLLGLFGAISYSPSISTFTFGKTLGEGSTIPLLYCQPIFLLWFVVHAVVSGRYYTGVLAKKYWRNIKSDEPFRIGAE